MQAGIDLLPERADEDEHDEGQGNPGPARHWSVPVNNVMVAMLSCTADSRFALARKPAARRAESHAAHIGEMAAADVTGGVDRVHSIGLCRPRRN
jgi:hypothetical protein